MLERHEFIHNIMSSKLQAAVSNNPIKNLMNVLATLQAHTFYADKDIMTQVSACQDRDYLNMYILERLSDLSRNAN